MFSWPIGLESKEPKESLQEVSEGPAPDSLGQYQESHVSITGICSVF